MLLSLNSQDREQHFHQYHTEYQGPPHVCVLSPLLFAMLIQNCAAMYSSHPIVKFTDTILLVGLMKQ